MTRREHLKVLPVGLRKRVNDNLKKENLRSVKETLGQHVPRFKTILSAFEWQRSNEGSEFWVEVHYKYFAE